MEDQKRPPSLDDIEARLRVARAREETESQGPSRRQRPQGMALGFRIGVELVVTVVVGTGIGWGLDTLMGTRPWLMVLFLLLGGAAGVMNVYRLMRGMDESVGLGGAERRAKESKDH